MFDVQRLMEAIHYVGGIAARLVVEIRFVNYSAAKNGVSIKHLFFAATQY